MLNKDDRFEIMIDYYGNDENINKLPFIKRSLFDIIDNEISKSIFAGCTGQELKQIIRELKKNDDIGETISIKNKETNETWEGWDEMRKVLKLKEY